MDELAPPPSSAVAPRWRPIPAIDRRLIGVLIEKAKTTPDAYPMSANSLRTGANQKNNRYPLMELEIEDIEESLARLRGLGAVTEVQGGGRVPRFRHHLYEWLGVDKVELGVMAELLLRGAQTEGELRGRTARMDPISDVNALRPILASLKSKQLIVSLTPEGRGHVVTHALYEPRELEKLQVEHRQSPPPAESHAAPRESAAGTVRANLSPATQIASTRESACQASDSPADQRLLSRMAELSAEVDQLRSELARLRRDVDDLVAQLR